jgi:hypothetical protein
MSVCNVKTSSRHVAFVPERVDVSSGSELTPTTRFPITTK